MRVNLHNTSKVVELELDGVRVPARLWEGHTANGIPVIAWITRIAAERDQDLREFDADLAEQVAPSPAAEAFPMRMLLG
jgi:hypothetical protein